MNELTDLLGVLAIVAFMAGLGAVTVRALLLRLRQVPPPQRHGMAYLLAGLTVLYLLIVAAGVPSVLLVLGNNLDDIPLTSTLRTAVLAGIMWTLHTLLLRLARGRLQ